MRKLTRWLSVFVTLGYFGMAVLVVNWRHIAAWVLFVSGAVVFAGYVLLYFIQK